MKDRWTCPNCDNSIVVHVRLNEPPLCSNSKAHTSKTYEMQRETSDKRD